MKLIAIVPALALVSAACGGGAGQTAATTAPARTTAAATTAAPTQAASLVFTAALKSTEEVPPIANAESTCTGTATVTFDRAANKAKFELELSTCPATTAPTIAHIHRGAKGANGGVVVNTGLVAGEWKLTNGAGKITKDVAAVDAAVLSEIVASPSGFYMNIHSAMNGGGVVRAQLEKKS